MAAGERWMAAEFHRLQARLRKREGEPLHAVRARTEKAIAIAREQGATLFLERANADMTRWM